MLFPGLPANFTASTFVSDNEQGLLSMCINVPVSDFQFRRDLQFNFGGTGVGNAGKKTHTLHVFHMDIAMLYITWT